MFNWFNNFEIEKYSFLLGFLSASLIWLVFIVIRKFIPAIKISISNFLKIFKQSRMSIITEAVYKDAYNRSQKNHIAGNLCPLDQILIEPQLLVPPVYNFGNEDAFIESEINSLIPYSPDFPILSRNFAVPKIQLIEALQDGANIVVSGQPGMGKTVALANLVNQLAMNDPICARLKGRVPFYFHIFESDFFEKPSQSMFDIVYKSISKNLPSSVIPRFAQFIKSKFNESNILLIIDGLDELHKAQFDQFTDFLENFMMDFPRIQIVLTASPYYIGHLPELGFNNLAIAAHSIENNNLLIKKWINLWYQQIFSANSEQPFQTKEKLITNWTASDLRLLSPLEITLFIWGALSGHLRGEGTLSIYESLFVRVFGQAYDPEKLSDFAGEFIKRNSNSIPQPHKYAEIIKTLNDAGIIQENSAGSISFKYLDFLGFLSSFNPSNLTKFAKIDEIATNPLANACSSFAIARDQQISWIEELIGDEKPPTYFNIFIFVPWLRHSHQKSSFKNLLLKKLFRLFQNKAIPANIRLRFLASILLVNDPTTNNLIKQLLSQPDQQTLDLTLIALGIGNDQELYMSDLINLLESKEVKTQKLSALDLAIIDNQSALHALAKLLLSGEESLRKLVAELLALKQEEGLDIIKDAITLDDILVRRSAIFGLIRVNEIWATELIQKLSYEDSQWVIRNIASQALDFLKGENPYIPQKQKPVDEDQWLITLASQHNLGISSHVSITPIIIQGLKDEDPENVFKALGYIESLEEINLSNEVSRLLNSKNQILSEKAFETCWKLFIQGKNIPLQKQ